MLKKFFSTTQGKDLLAILFFIMVGAIYFFPVLMGYDLRLGDVDNARGMAGFVNYFHEFSGDPALWNPNAFLGMPSYMIYYPNPYFFSNVILSKFFIFFGLGLGGFLFMCFGFYTLLKSFNYGPLLSAGGSLLYAFSGYFIVVLSAGHFNKIYAVGAFPFLFAGIVHLLKDRKQIGYLTITFGGLVALLSNHPQIFYYYSWILGIYLLVELYKLYKKGTISAHFKQFSIAAGILIICGLAVSESYLNTYNYSKSTIRGDNDISSPSSGDSETGLDLSYITQWSYGIEESFNLIIPAFKGGGSSQIGNRSETKNVSPRFKQNIESSSLYWGNQPFTAGPSYMGIVVFILFVFGMVFIKNRMKWIFFGLSILALMLAWGKNFMGLTEFFVNYFPLYKKFRAVTMIHSIIGFCFPLVGIWFLNDLLKGKIDYKKKKFFVVSGMILGGLIVFYLAGDSMFSFISNRENANFAQQASSNDQMRGLIQKFVDELISVRFSIFKTDILRALFFAIISVGSVYYFFKGKLKPVVFTCIILFFACIDLIQADKRIINTDKVNNQYKNFVKKNEKATLAFAPSQADMEILQAEVNSNPALGSQIKSVQLSNTEIRKAKDTKKEYLLFHKQMNTLGRLTNYRVLNLSTGTFTDARTSYYHKSIGGYHAAKLRKFQNLIDAHFGQQGFPESILKTLNVKYLITPNGVVKNTSNLGAAWFVSEIRKSPTQGDVLTNLKTYDLKKVALIPTGETVFPATLDTTREVTPKSFSPDKLIFEISAGEDAFLVLSEMYYSRGWKAYFEDKEISINNVNYWMRGILIPASQKGILEVSYEPEDKTLLSSLSFIGNSLWVIILMLLLFQSCKVHFLAIKQQNQ